MPMHTVNGNFRGPNCAMREHMEGRRGWPTGSKFARQPFRDSRRQRICLLEDRLIGCHDLVTVVHGVEDVLPQAVAQAQTHDLLDVVISHLRAAIEGAEGSGGPVRHDVAAETVDVQGAADHRDFAGEARGDYHLAQICSGDDDLVRKLLVVLQKFFTEALRVVGELLAAVHDLHAEVRVPLRPDHGMHAEAVEQLGPQLTLLGVAAAHEDELGGVPDADALALDSVPAACGAVKQNVDQVVIQEVDLVDVQNAAVRPRQEARLEGLLALGQGLLDVDGAADPVLGGAQRQVDHRHLSLANRKHIAPGRPVSDLVAHVLGLRWRGVVGVVGHTVDLGQEVDERADGRRLACATVSQDHHAADLRVDDVQDKRQLHLRLPHDGREREDGPRLLHLDLGRLGHRASDDLLLRRPLPETSGHAAGSNTERQPNGSLRDACSMLLLRMLNMRLFPHRRHAGRELQSRTHDMGGGEGEGLVSHDTKIRTRSGSQAGMLQS
mmetsp:Transcript_48531/g.156706  ORF Transcript_48531/g.156706 Transcript_48531/m.156706 type:complete len:495 (-) Transcript_48531:12-1496(-)